MPRYSEESIRLVAEASDIVDVIGAYVPLKRAGSSYKALCPFHQEKTPSFTVSPARQAFYCFGCGAGGGVIRFVMDYERISFGEAVRKLAARAGIKLIEESLPQQHDTQRQLREQLLALHETLAAWFHKLLLKDAAAEAARNALAARGINLQTAKNWQLGYAPQSSEATLEFLLSRKFKTTEILASGVIGKDEATGKLYPRFRHRLIIPICDDAGSVVGFSARILEDGSSGPKYINSPETAIFQKGRLLFGLHKSKRALAASGEAIVCEGQFDLITAYENGVHNVVAPQGTAFTPHQARLLSRFVRSVILCFDGDAAGEKAITRSLPALLAQNLSVRVLLLPPGEDPDSLIRKEGGRGFRERAAASKDALEEIVHLAERRGDLSQPATLAASARSIAGLLACIQDPIARDAAAQRAAQLLRVPPVRLAELLNQAPRPAEPLDEPVPAPAQAESDPPRPLEPMPEPCVFLCRQLMESAEALEWLRGQDWQILETLGEGWRPLRLILASDATLDSPREWSVFLAACEPALQSALAQASNRPPAKEPLHAVQETWRGLQRLHLQERIEQIKARLRHPSTSGPDILRGQKELLDLQKKLLEFSEPSSASSQP